MTVTARNTITFNAALAGCARSGKLDDAKDLVAQVQTAQVVSQLFADDQRQHDAQRENDHRLV